MFSRKLGTLDATDQDFDMAHAVSTECLKRSRPSEADDVEDADLRGMKRAIRVTSGQSEKES